MVIYKLINPYGHKGSEFAPIAIHVHFILCILYSKEKSEKFIEHIRNNPLTSNFNYNRVSLIDHVKRNATTLKERNPKR